MGPLHQPQLSKGSALNSEEERIFKQSQRKWKLGGSATAPAGGRSVILPHLVFHLPLHARNRGEDDSSTSSSFALRRFGEHLYFRPLHFSSAIHPT